MRLITKNFTTSVAIRHQQELQAQRLDEQSLLDPNVHSGLSGKRLWKMVRDIKVIPHLWELKHQMYEEQGGLCCYCGLRIFKDSEGRKQSVEHIIPKGIQRELVGEYKNLLLSCSTTEDDAILMEADTLSEDLHSAADAGSGQPSPPYNCFLNSVGDMPAFCLKNRAKWLG